MAGVAAAIPNNGFGVAGVAYQASILNVKVTTAAHPNSESCSAMSSGVVAAVNAGAQVINISSGSQSPCALEQEAVTYAWNHGALVVAAAGNYGSTEPFYPAAYEHVISVASTDASGHPASFADGATTDRSSSWVDLVAPGVDVLTTLPTYSNPFGEENFGFVEGTSFSTPMVTGAAALLFADGLSNSQVESRLFQSADPIAGTGVDWKYGLLDVCAAVATNRSSCPQVNPGPSPSLATPSVTVEASSAPASYVAGDTRRQFMPQPVASTYRGRTSQHVPITVQVDSSGTLAKLSFSYQSGCGGSGSSAARLNTVALRHRVSLSYQNGAWGFHTTLAVGAQRQGFEVQGSFSGRAVAGSLQVKHGSHGPSCTRSITWKATR